MRVVIPVSSFDRLIAFTRLLVCFRVRARLGKTQSQSPTGSPSFFIRCLWACSVASSSGSRGISLSRSVRRHRGLACGGIESTHLRSPDPPTGALTRQFDSFAEFDGKGPAERDRQMVDWAARWRREHGAERPYFMLLFFDATHRRCPKTTTSSPARCVTRRCGARSSIVTRTASAMSTIWRRSCSRASSPPAATTSSPSSRAIMARSSGTTVFSATPPSALSMRGRRCRSCCARRSAMRARSSVRATSTSCRRCSATRASRRSCRRRPTATARRF